MNTMPHVNLRAMEPEDLDMLYHIENDETMWNVGLTNVPYSRFVLHEFMSETTGDIYTDKQVRLIIEDENHQSIGIADIMKFDPKNRKAEVGIVISCPYRQKGYAKAALTYIHKYAQDTLHLHQLYVIIAHDNESSLLLFQQMGYRQMGCLSDWLYDGHSYHDAQLLQCIL